jgi:hypothetical protein
MISNFAHVNFLVGPKIRVDKRKQQQKVRGSSRENEPTESIPRAKNRRHYGLRREI